MEDRKFVVLFAATILAARKLSELDAQGITRPLPGAGDHHHGRNFQVTTSLSVAAFPLAQRQELCD